ncbi:DUF4149 domain-containing protein [Piscinibacter sp.]|uniref:DUF4149 domain-containing protein n=1 Tax=Piscinibacter sp. TaxID=1903157 RepID=UPI0039E2D398
MAPSRIASLLAGLWAGALLAVGLIGAPAAFAVLATPAEAGRVAGRMFSVEAPLSLALAMVLFLLERRRARDGGGSQFSTGMLLALGALFCTVAGYYAVLPMMDAVRAGQSTLTFATLHIVSTAFFALKGLLVLALAWRLSRPPASS